MRFLALFRGPPDVSIGVLMVVSCASFSAGSDWRRPCAAMERDNGFMRLLLFPLLFATAIIVTLVLLAAPPKPVAGPGKVAAAVRL